MVTVSETRKRVSTSALPSDELVDDPATKEQHWVKNAHENRDIEIFRACK